LSERHHELMSNQTTELDDRPLSPDEMNSALFAQMIMHLASTALVMLGRMPNPMTGKTETDLDTARLLIDQLEMLDVKTKGNLTGEERHLLNQNLMAVRMAFVEAVEKAGTTPAAAAADAPAPTPTAQPAQINEEDSKKKFSKSYGTP
jgi:hypothetical protein